jgi:DNA-binding MarR family transcriptional regulator
MAQGARNMAIEAHLPPSDPLPELAYGSISYTPAPAVHFCLSFLRRDWFGSKLEGAEALTFTLLMLTIYGVQKEGLLMSKKDAMREIGAEHVATVKRYVTRAEELGMLRVEQSHLDRRIELLVLTEAGTERIEKELATIVQAMHWTEASLAEGAKDMGVVLDPPILKLADDHAPASEFKSSMTVDPPRLEDLAVVADRFSRAGKPRPGYPSLRPRTHHRWIAAYQETLRVLPKNVEALDACSETHIHLGENDEALPLVERLVKLNPAYLRRRAFLYERLGKYDLAITDVNQALERGDDAPAIRLTRARAYANKREWNLALEDLNAASEYGSRLFRGGMWSYDWAYLRGIVHANLGNLREALADLQHAHKGIQENIGMYQDLLRDPDPMLSIATPEEDVIFWRELAAHVQEIIAQVEELRKTKGRKTSN